VRSEEQLEATLDAVSRWKPYLTLCGVELFEGVLTEQGAVGAFVARAVDVARRLATERRFDRSPIILSGAGSAWFDVVADSFSEANLGQPVDVVLRPGCYLTHDAGSYVTAQSRMQATNSVAQSIGSSLLPALQIWAYVLSIPEPQKAIVGFGKRDASFDSGLPMPCMHFRPGWPSPLQAPTGWKVTKMMDQHAFLEIEIADDLRVGDMISYDISHPCLTFDKWRYLPIVDRDLRVVDIVETFF
jgi:D-serine dehydratase